MLLSQSKRPGFQNGCSQAANTCAFVLVQIFAYVKSILLNSVTNRISATRRPLIHNILGNCEVLKQHQA